MKRYVRYYNGTRTHLLLEKDAPGAAVGGATV